MRNVTPSSYATSSLISAGSAETVGFDALPERCTFGSGVGSSGFAVGFFVVVALPEASGDSVGDASGEPDGATTGADEVPGGLGEPGGCES
jgi:hypothetical protein